MSRLFQLLPIIFLVLLILGCGSDNPSGPDENSLIGTWSESYHLQYLGGIQPEEGDDTEGELFTSTILFDGSDFKLRIRDSLDVICKEVTGDFEFTGDMIVLKVEYSWHRFYEERSIPYDPYAEYTDTLMITGMDKDTLVLNTMSHYDEETGMVTVKINSIIWTVPRLSMYFTMKTTGTFVRDR